MDYERDTRNAYRNKIRANSYQDQYVRGLKWARFTMWKQKRVIEDFIRTCNLKESESILDLPCGAGYIGDLLEGMSAKSISSDISLEMIDLARRERKVPGYGTFVQSDIVNSSFRSGAFTCVVVLALMHRLPNEIRKQALSEIMRLSRRYIIVSYSVESPAQELKRRLLRCVKPAHIPAPFSMPLRDIICETVSHGCKVLKISHVAYFLSGKIVLLLEKNSS